MEILVNVLEANFEKVKLDNGAEAWDSGSKQYVEEAFNNVVYSLENRNQKLVAKAPTQVTSGYRPEIDVTT